MKKVRLRVSSFFALRNGGFPKLFLCLCIFVLLGAIAPVVNWNWFKQEKDKKAPADYGYGPNNPIGPPRPPWVLGQVPSRPKTAASSRAAAPTRAAAPNSAAVPMSGGGVGGFFGPAFPWPIIPLHIALLPDGSVLSYGTDQNGDQGALQNPALAPTGSPALYDVWNPTIGIGANAHTILTSSTVTTDLFCSAVSVLANGNALVVGGDLTVNGVRNYSNNQVEIFNPTQNTLTAAGKMTYARWYPSITTLPNGDKLVLGGQLTPSPSAGEPTPEAYSATYGWRTLTGISIDPTDWYYPRGFVGPDGAVYLLQQSGVINRLTTDYAGTLTDTGSRLDTSDATQPSVMTIDVNGNPFSALMARWGAQNDEVQSVDFSKNPPVVTRVGNTNYFRVTGQFTLLPNGQVFASGGSTNFNDLTTAIYQSEVYNRTTGTWTLDATAAEPRLYHNSALLLPDGSVLTAGGGAPGPVNELNAEIYYPAYLYLQDGSGNPAPRPTIISAPSTSTALTLGQNFSVTVGANNTISMINLIRVGADTHNFNSEQRLIPVPFTQSGTQITATLSASPELAPPGYYMLFVFNTAGVPAIANIIKIGLSLPDLTPTSLSYNSTTGLFTVVVLNQGTAATPAGVVIGSAFYVDGTYVTWGAVPGPLAPGASVSIVSSGGGAYTIPPGTHTINVFVDDVDRIVKSNTNDNMLSETITVSGSLPDLTPTSLSYNSTTGLFTVVVKNVGAGSTPAGVVIGNAFDVNGTQVTWGAVPGPLAPGASVSIDSSGGGAYTIPPGTYTISVIVDDVDRIQMSTRSNNTLTETITVSGSLPDLTPTSLSYSSTTGLFTVVVKNVGAGSTPAGVVIGNAFDVNGTQVTWGAVPGPLAPGASVSIDSSGGGAYTIPPGTYTISVIVDDVDRIQMSTRSNDTLTETITVP